MYKTGNERRAKRGWNKINRKGKKYILFWKKMSKGRGSFFITVTGILVLNNHYILFVGKSNYCFPAIKVTFTTEKNSYLFELIMTEILKKWGKIMMIKIFSTLITCTAELVKGPEG